MMKFLIAFGFLSLSTFLFPQKNNSDDFRTLCRWLQGIYSSEEQSKNDSDFIHINLQIIPIWKSQDSAVWFYVEQAVAQYSYRPYRQRIYKLIETEPGVFESIVYTFNDPLRFAGNVELLEKTLTPDSLIIRSGCSVFLTKTDENTFMGTTRDKDCVSELRQAKYATSDVILHNDKMITWDRGFNNEGKQVWGSVKGGYIFNKIKNID